MASLARSATNMQCPVGTGARQCVAPRMTRPARRLHAITRVANVDESNFEQEVLKADKAVLVDFWDTWCGPCKLMDPLMAWAEQEYASTLKVVKIRHDSCPKLIQQYKVYGLPAFLIFKNGELVPGCKREGAVNQKMLADYIKQFGGDQ
uniref:Thioredoxin domain-containing protein n=1 Tax=Dunaliella tertiolecta TaxID=3047 RepID=A0A7S3QW98_DUNTE|mmetsp:Transcript_22686/g.62637  ORF Transcript_22686/g.62637 Transcript_22686/m.62637 type:complete len:149 (+) Transcript_22686:60-506(+)